MDIDLAHRPVVPGGGAKLLRVSRLAMKQTRYTAATIGAMFIVLGGCESTGKKSSPIPSSQTSQHGAVSADPLHPRAEVKTNFGDFIIALDAEKAPAASLHFVQYVEKKFYDKTLFHRVPEVPVIIQAGGYTSDMELKNARYSTAFPGHWSTEFSNKKWSVALLRGWGPAGTGTAEFFINVADNKSLDESNDGHRFAIFGEVVEGKDTVEKIRNVPIATHPKYADGQSRVVPVTPVIIESIRLLTPLDHELARARAEEMHRTPSDPVAALIEELEKKSGNKSVRTDSGIVLVEFVTGRGPKPLISDRIEFHYTGTFLNGETFETTIDRDPFVREVSKLNAGLMETILSMNEGTRSTAIIPPELAYGTGGIPGIIPPGVMLVYDIELLAIVGPENP